MDIMSVEPVDVQAMFLHSQSELNRVKDFFLAVNSANEDQDVHSRDVYHDLYGTVRDVDSFHPPKYSDSGGDDIIRCIECDSVLNDQSRHNEFVKGIEFVSQFLTAMILDKPHKFDGCAMSELCQTWASMQVSGGETGVVDSARDYSLIERPACSELSFDEKSPISPLHIFQSRGWVKLDAVQHADIDRAVLHDSCDENVDEVPYFTVLDYDTSVTAGIRRDKVQQRRLQQCQRVEPVGERDDLDLNDDVCVRSYDGTEFCYTCRFFVTWEKHRVRCKPRSDASIRQWIRAAAWLGDAYLGAHVRVALLVKSGVEGDEFQRFTSNNALALAYEKLPPHAVCGKSFMARGSSEHSLATAVEAAYALSPEYRHQLVEWLGLPAMKSYLHDKIMVAMSAKLIRSVGLSIEPHENVYGYGYMSLAGGESFSGALGPFPLFGQVLLAFSLWSNKGVWFLTDMGDGVIHISRRKRTFESACFTGAARDLLADKIFDIGLDTTLA